MRIRAVGLTASDSFDLPLTQGEFGETLGLTTVHVNRTLQDLRSQQLITLKGKHLTLLDLEALQKLALFNPNYLHFLHKPQAITGNDQLRRAQPE